MWTQTYAKVFTGVTRAQIWRAWADVNRWPEWHAGLEYCSLQGPFAVGNHFILKPEGMSAVKIAITEIDPERRFTDCTAFLGARMYDVHTLEDTEKGVLVTNTLMVTGPLGWLWTRLVARKVAAGVPADMESLAAYAATLP